MTLISQVGSIAQALSATATPTTVAMTTTAKGNALVYLSRVTSDVGGNRRVATVAGGGATWTELLQYQPFGISIRHAIWLGIVNTPTAGNITSTHAGSNASTNSAAMIMEITAGLGPDTVWETDGTPAGFARSTAGTTVPFPSQTPDDIDRAYFGFSSTSVAASYGSAPAGFTFLAQTGSSSNGMIWRLSCPVSAQAPSVTMASGGVGTVSAMLKARAPKHGGGMTVLAGGLAHHRDELAGRRAHRDRWQRRESGIYCRDEAA